MSVHNVVVLYDTLFFNTGGHGTRSGADAILTVFIGILVLLIAGLGLLYFSGLHRLKKEKEDKCPNDNKKLNRR